MSRIRMMVMAACSIVALIAFGSALRAQAPGNQGGQGGSVGPDGPGGGGRRDFRDGPGGGPGGFFPGGRGGPGRNGSYRSLLSRPEVQNELKLTDQQKVQIDQVDAQLDQQGQQRFQAMRDMRNNEGPPDPEARQAMREAFTAMRQQSDQALGGVLTASQRSRLQEISLQQQGPMAVATDPAVQKALNLSPDQVIQLQMIMNESHQARRQSFQGRGEMFRQLRASGLDREAIHAKMQSPEVKSQMEQMQKQAEALRQQTIQQISRVLTKKQKQAFNKMLGEPFTLQPRNRPGGSDGDGGNGGDGPAANPTSSASPDGASASGTTTIPGKTGNRRSPQ